jgi:hypothetical protein
VRHPGGIRVVEVPMTRTDLRELLQAVATAVHGALQEADGVR